MKKLIPFVAIAALAMMFTSCKKDYTCSCTTTFTGSSPVNSSMKTGKLSKKDAKAMCEKNNGTTTVSGISATVSCKID